jgi:FkbH-like protein
MYETEANFRQESADQLPAGTIARFAEMKDLILERTVLPWSEHCTECVWPTCYSTCDLYDAREDGRCRRFSDGMVRIECREALSSYVLKIRFKRWGKLWTPGNLRLRSLREAQRIERRDHRIGTVLHRVSRFSSMPARKRYSLKKRMAHRATATNTRPSCFLVECYNPADKLVRLTLTMRSTARDAKVPFQTLLEILPGFQRVRVPYEDIRRFLDLDTPFTIDLTPNEEQTETTLYFGTMEFVRERPQLVSMPAANQKNGGAKVKCVVWDLDNTIWDGILVEDGPEHLRLKPRIEDVLKTLDERGILLSIASKNNHDEAMAALSKFGIREYFLCPQISWHVKSQSVQTIAQQLNIGMDSMLFVDDSEFELEQVTRLHPEVRVLHANSYFELTAMEECQVPVTEESRTRRKLYQIESQRHMIAENFGDDYTTFLKYCNIRLTIRPMSQDSLSRVHELTQRTNQMNFSGTRYEQNVLQRVLTTPYLDTYVLSVEDRFGSYGIVGFCIVDHRVPLMTDLMFSCRVQSKHIEHAFLTFLVQKYISSTGKDFYANYRQTTRNAPSGQVFADLRFEALGTENGITRLRFSRDRQVRDDQIIETVVEDSLETAQS